MCLFVLFPFSLSYRLVQERFALRRDADPGQLLALLTWLSWSKAWRGSGTRNIYTTHNVHACVRACSGGWYGVVGMLNRHLVEVKSKVRSSLETCRQWRQACRLPEMLKDVEDIRSKKANLNESNINSWLSIHRISHISWYKVWPIQPVASSVCTQGGLVWRWC